MMHTFDHPHATNIQQPILGLHTSSEPRNAPLPIGQAEGTTGPPAELVSPTDSESIQEDRVHFMDTVSTQSLITEIREYKGRLRPIVTKLLDLGSALDDIGAVSLGLEYIQWYSTPGPCTKDTPKYMAGVDLWNRVTALTKELSPTSQDSSVLVPDLTKEATVNEVTTPTTPTTPSPVESIRAQRTEIRDTINAMPILSIYTDIRSMRPWKGRDILIPLIASHPTDTEIQEISRGFLILTAFQSTSICTKAKWAYYYTRVEAYTPPTPTVPLGERLNVLGRRLRTKALGALDSLSTTGTMLAEQAGKDMGKYMAVTLHTATTIKRSVDKEWDRTHRASHIRAHALHMTRKSQWKSAMAIQRLQNTSDMQRELRESIAAMAMDTGVQGPCKLENGGEAEL